MSEYEPRDPKLLAHASLSPVLVLCISSSGCVSDISPSTFQQKTIKLVIPSVDLAISS